MCIYIYICIGSASCMVTCDDIFSGCGASESRPRESSPFVRIEMSETWPRQNPCN